MFKLLLLVTYNLMDLIRFNILPLSKLFYMYNILHNMYLLFSVCVEEKHKSYRQWQNIVKFCRQNNQAFVDENFTPSGKSLYYNQKVS